MTQVFHGVITGCEPSLSSGMNVHVDGGYLVNQNIFALVTGGDITLTDSLPDQDRYDLVVADTAGTLYAVDGYPGLFSDGTAVQPESSDVSILSVPVFAGTTAITSGIQDLRTYVSFPSQSPSFEYTFLSTTSSTADPGFGNVAFDAASNTAVGHMYVSYFSPSSPSSVRYWLQGGNVGTPFDTRYYRFWSKSNPSLWWVAKHDSITNHTTYADVGLTFQVSSVGTNAPPMVEDTADTVVQVIEYNSGSVSSSGQFLQRTIYTSGTTATHTFDTSCNTADLTLVGGGAGGGGADNNTAINTCSAAGGGGGGATCFKRITVGGTRTCTYTVGGSGSGGTSGAGNGSDGGDSIVVYTSTTATGGKGLGGQGSHGGNGFSCITPGLGGTSTGGDLNISGAPGTAGVRWNGTDQLTGWGGSSTLGAGAYGTTQNQNTGTTVGVAGTVYGGGGSGAGALRAGGANAGAVGGAGAAGVVIIDEYT